MAFTDLIKIERPFGTALSPIALLNATAWPGENVEIFVYVRNQHTETVGIRPKVIVNGTTEVIFTVPYANAPPGVTYYFTGHFIMPSVGVELRAESQYYGTDGQWHSEDMQTRTIPVLLPGWGEETLAIDSVVVRGSAAAGEVVSIAVTLINKYIFSFLATPTATINSMPLYFGERWIALSPDGGKFTWYDSFIMPNHDVNVHVESWSQGVFPETDTYDVEVTLKASPELKHLVINRDPDVGGTVTTSPAAQTGTVYDGYYPVGTTVLVTAHPNPGYSFKSWSAELVDTTEPTAPVYMTENRTVRAHFELVLIDTEILEVEIIPVETGHVTTEPASVAGKTVWRDKDTGDFHTGTDVLVTAHAYLGYQFDHWSDEIVGGTSTNNPEYVKPMTEHRTVKAHFVGIADGIISSKYIIHGTGTFGDDTVIPALNILTSEWMKLKIIARNTSATQIVFGLRYVITKPSGATLADTTFQGAATPPEGEHTFIEPTFTQYDIDELGDWNILIELLDGSSNVLDSYNGLLLRTIGEEPPSPGEGITELIIIHGTGLFAGTEKVPPVSGVETGNWFKLKVTGVNPSTSALQMGLHYIITKPDGTTLEDTEKEAWPHTGAGESHVFIEPTVDAFNVDQIGDWALSIELLGGDAVLDTWQGLIFTNVVEPPPSGFGSIGEIINLMITMMIMVMMMTVMTGVIQDPAKAIEKGSEIAGRAVRAFKGRKD